MGDPTSTMAKSLASRSKAPGSDRSFRAAEVRFATTLRRLLPESDFEVDEKPKELRQMFGGDLGIEPDAKITHIPSQKVIYFEVKSQGQGGNAEERGFKNHTVQFQKMMKERLGLPYHPFVLIMCRSLATMPRYTKKIVYYVEPDHYLLWDQYDLELLYQYLRKIISDWFSYILPPAMPQIDETTD